MGKNIVKDLKKLSIGKTTLGLAAICAVALSMQTINRHLTKKRTGKDGFVGDPDYDKHPVDKPKPKDAKPRYIQILSIYQSLSRNKSVLNKA